MANDWRDASLGDLIRLQRGHDLTDSQREAGNIPVMGSAGQNGFHNISKAKGPGLVIGRSGASFGKVHYSAVDYWPHNTALYVTDFLGNDEFFTFYFLRTIDFSSYNSGSAQPSLNRNHIYLMPVKIPTLPEQKVIAHILGSLDDKIELNRRMNATLEGISRALFKSWFVDFDPVIDNALAAGNPIPEEFAARAETRRDVPNPGNNISNHWKLFPDSFQPSELGPIPSGWSVQAIESLCDVLTSGGTPARMNKAYWEPATIPWFKTGELFDGPLIDAKEKISEAGLANSSCKLWPAGTVLFALYASPTVGRFGVLTKPGTANQAAAALIAKSAYGVPFLVGLLFKARAELQRVAVGAAQQNINQGVLKNHIVIVPPPQLAKAYSDRAAPLFERRVKLAEQSRTLSSLRDTLLPKLISGELRIEDAEKLAEEAMS